MDDSLPEVIVACSNGGCNLYNATSGNSIASYNDANTFSPKTLAFIGEDHLIGAYSNKPFLKTWRINKKVSPKLRKDYSFPTPGIVSALAVTSCGNYCIAGIKDKIYVWEVTTGDLLIELSRHYQSVTCLKFTADDSRFFSCGKDGHVIVWILSSVIDVNARQHGDVKPQFVWTHHSAEVTDIYCGNSISRVATTSLDMTCKVYELDSGKLLASICMEVPLTSVVMDLLEYFIFLGDDRGFVYKINTYEKLPHELHRADMSNKAAIKLHETRIISLNVSIDGKLLLTASEDQSCKVWDMQSMACLLNLRFEGALTNAFFAMRPQCFTNEMVEPQILEIPTFQRDLALAKHSNQRYIKAKISPKELSLMYDGCPDKYYGHSLFCQKPGIKAEDMDTTKVEDIFQAQVYGETVSDLTTLNQQIFTYSLNDKLAVSFASPPSPS